MPQAVADQLGAGGDAELGENLQGERLLADLDRSLLRVDDHILAPLTDTERQTLHALLAKAVRHIGPVCTVPGGADC